MQARFFVLMRVGNKPCNEMDDKIGGATMTRMLNLRNIFQLVDDGLDDGSFARTVAYPIGA
jgi:hypothetical protein